MNVRSMFTIVLQVEINENFSKLNLLEAVENYSVRPVFCSNLKLG